MVFCNAGPSCSWIHSQESGAGTKDGENTCCSCHNCLRSFAGSNRSRPATVGAVGTLCELPDCSCGVKTKQRFVVNGEVYDDQPGSPLDIAKLLNIHVPAAGEALTDFKFNIRAPGSTATQVVPADLLALIQEIADLHGHPGISLVLSFLNSLKQVQKLSPGQTINIDTQVCTA